MRYPCKLPVVTDPLATKITFVGISSDRTAGGRGRRNRRGRTEAADEPIPDSFSSGGSNSLT